MVGRAWCSIALIQEVIILALLGRLLGRSYRHRVVAVVGVGLVGRLSLLDLVHILVARHLVLLVLHLWGRHIVLTKGCLIQLGLCIAGA